MSEGGGCETVEQLLAEKSRLENLLASLKADVKLHENFEVKGC